MYWRMHIPCTIEFKIQAYFCLNWTTIIPCQRNFWFCKSFSRFFKNLLIYIFLVCAILLKWFSDYETWTELRTSCDISSITIALVYCAFFQLYKRFITYTINSMFCQISGFMLCLDQVIAVAFKLSSYRRKVSANEILESFFSGFQIEIRLQIRDSISIFTN